MIRKAFKELRSDGWFAEQDFMCCQTCGLAETPDDKPYIFYHIQDTDTLNDYGYTYLSFGQMTDRQMKHCVSVLDKHMLCPEWDGDYKTRIRINPSV